MGAASARVRDTVDLRRGDGSGTVERVPAVALGDPTYEARGAVLLVDDGERRALALSAQRAGEIRFLWRVLAAAFLSACAAAGAAAGVITALHR